MYKKILSTFSPLGGIRGSFLLLLLSSLNVSAQNQEQNSKLKIGAELRPLTIIDNGYKTPQTQDDETVAYTTQRTRLNASFTFDKLETFISFQDVRIWGDDDNYKSSGVYGNTESICLHQTWAELKITNPLSLKVGRQQFSYDDQRIISARNWNNYQITYDALLAEYKSKKSRLHVALSYNADNKSDRTYPDNKFKTFNFIHYQHKLEKLTLSGIAVVSGNTLTDSTSQLSFKGTYGVNANYNTSKTNARLSAYYQHNLNNTDDAVSALCFSLYAERQILDKLNIGLGIDYISGNDETSTSTTDNKFDLLYGKRHGWYGYMDYFSTTPDQGLQDYMLKFTYKPQKKLIIYADCHHFLLSADQNNSSNEKLSRNLGSELDLKLKWKCYSMATLECGYAIFATTSTLEEIKKVSGSDLKTPFFCYIMLSIKPEIIF